MCQLFLLICLGLQTRYDEKLFVQFKETPEMHRTILCRFLCAVFLHITLSDEIKQGFVMMKFALNHDWKFEQWWRAFLVGFLQSMVGLSVEIVNLILLFTKNEVLDIIGSFLACVFIS